jgi:hypothetical protein
VQHGDNLPGQDFAWFRCGDDRDAPTSHELDRSMRAQAVRPTTVNVSDLGDGALFLQVWPDGPSVYLGRGDAGPLKRELAAAFRSTELAQRSSQGESQ